MTVKVLFLHRLVTSGPKQIVNVTMDICYETLFYFANHKDKYQEQS